MHTCVCVAHNLTWLAVLCACHAAVSVGGGLSSRVHQEDLNRQEVELMSRVRELRERLVKSTGASHSLGSVHSNSPLLQSVTT